MFVKTELDKIFKADDIQALIYALINDRIFQTNKTVALLNDLLLNYIDDFNYVKGSKVNESLITSNPMLYMLLATVVENGNDTLSLRDEAANAYKKLFEDSRFEKHYFYSKNPLPLLTHWLVYSKRWKEANKDAYDEQMMGLYKGTVAFDIDDVISQEMLNQITAQEKKGKKGWPYPFETALEPQENGTYKVTKWATTAEMDDDIHARLDRLYVSARRNQHKSIMEKYASSLNRVSAEINALMPTENPFNALVVIGPYGSGKTTYTNSIFRLKEDKSLLVELSVDALNDLMTQQNMEARVTRSDYHFEAAILKDTINAATIKNLFVTGAYVDNYRFNKTIDKDYAGRNIRIIEIAPEIPENAVVRLCQREKITVTTDNSTFENTLSTANTGQNTREARINKVCAHDNKNYRVEYELICNKQTETGRPDFVSVCSVKNGELTKHDPVLYEKLTRSYSAKREDINKLLQLSNQAEINEQIGDQFKI